MNLIKIEEQYVRMGSHDIYINTDHIISIEDSGFTDCIIKLSNGSTIPLKMSAQDFINFLSFKGIIKYVTDVEN